MRDELALSYIETLEEMYDRSSTFTRDLGADCRRQFVRLSRSDDGIPDGINT
jgi:hypothetical protein